MIGNRWYPSVEQMPEVRLLDELNIARNFEDQHALYLGRFIDYGW